MPTTDEITVLADEIAGLIAEPGASLERLEHTLTTGYARALELEAERGRLARELGELAAAGDGDGAREAAARVSAADERLALLRALLRRLRDRAAAARA